MNRLVHSGILAAVLLAACIRAARMQRGRRQGAGSSRRSRQSPAVAVSATEAVEQPITRFIRATGSLTAEEQADVAAEIAGRVVATPVERGTAGDARRGAGAAVADGDRCAGHGSRGERRAD